MRVGEHEIIINDNRIAYIIAPSARRCECKCVRYVQSFEYNGKVYSVGDELELRENIHDNRGFVDNRFLYDRFACGRFACLLFKISALLVWLGATLYVNSTRS